MSEKKLWVLAVILNFMLPLIGYSQSVGNGRLDSNVEGCTDGSAISGTPLPYFYVVPRSSVITRRWGAWDPKIPATMDTVRDYLKQHATEFGLGGVDIGQMEVKFFQTPGVAGFLYFQKQGLSYPQAPGLDDPRFGFLFTLETNNETGSPVPFSFQYDTDRLPLYSPIRTHAAVAGDSDKITDQLINRELYHCTDHPRKRHFDGKLQRQDLYPPVLTLTSNYQEDGNVWVGLVWKYTQKLNDSTFYFSAENGDLVKAVEDDCPNRPPDNF